MKLNVMFAAACLCAINLPRCHAAPDGAVDAYWGDVRKRLLDITPDAQALLKQLEEQGREYRPVSGHTRLFVRTQLKYGLQRTDFLHNWYERPLYQDTTYAAANVKGRYLNERSWRKQVEVGRLSKLDGFAFFPSTRGREEAIGASVLPGAEFTMLPEMSGSSFKQDGGLAFCRQALAMPNSFRIGGRVVLTHFPEIGESKLEKFDALKARLVSEGIADRIALVPYSYVLPKTIPGEGHLAPRTDVALVESARRHVREMLRHVDGFIFTPREANAGRRYNPAFVDAFLAPVVKSVLMEPEFRGRKLFGLLLSQGHENDYRWTGIFDSTGTRSCRDMLATVERLRPDFAIGAEWDEEDENTHFRPTVSNGHVTQRLLRHYADMINGRPPEVFPGDDTSIPNLVLSYRKSLQAGELLETEVVNIPDGTAPADSWTVTLKWKTPDGRTVKEYAPTQLDARTCGAVWFKTPVSELVAEQVIVPELTVTAAGRTEVFGDGFWPVNLEANRNWDYKWMREALREIPRGLAGRLAVGPREADGTMLVSGEVTSPEELRSVEVLEGPDTVYMHGAPAAGPDEVCVRISLQGSNGSAERNKLTGALSIEGAPGVKCSPVAIGKLRQKGTGWTFHGMPFPNRFMLSGPHERTFYATMPAASAETAEVVVDLPPVFKTRIRVKDLLAREGVGVAGPYGAYLWAERFLRPVSQPPPIGGRNVRFSFRMRPKDPNGLLRLQTVDSRFRIWRGAVKTFHSPAGRSTSFHVFEKAQGRVSEVTLDANRLVSLDYSIGSPDGDVCWSGSNRLLPLVLGGTILPVTGVGAADGGGQMSPFRGASFTKDVACSNTAPKVVEEPEGFRSLSFDGYAYASLGLQVLPPFAGFALEMKLRCEDTSGCQGLFGTGNLGFEMWLEDGVSHVYMNRGTLQFSACRNEAEGASFKGPALTAGRWQTLRFVFDQSEAFLEVDGVKGEVQRFSDWQCNPCAAGVGRLGSSGLSDVGTIGGFKGRLARLRIEPR